MANKECVLTIKTKDGKELVFNSEDELNTFVRDNKKGLVSTILGKKSFFSQTLNLPQQTQELLKTTNANMHLRESDHVYYKKEGSVVTEGYTSTTQFIGKEHDLGGPDRKERMVPEFNSLNYFLDLATELRWKGVSEDHIDKIIAEKKKTFETSSISGTSFHKIAESFVLKNYSSAEDIIKDFDNLNLVQAQMYFEAMTKIINDIKRSHGDTSILIPEFIIVDEEKKITGTIDLLVIDSKGKIHIYDYKTSFKEISDWNQVKKNAVDYQLTTYKQILLRQGFDVGKTKYIPIRIDEYNESTNTVEAFAVETFMDSTLTSRGEVVYKINYLLPYEFKPKTDFIIDNKPVTEVLIKNFNYEIKNSLANVSAAKNTAKQQLDYLLSSGRRDTDRQKREFIWLPSIGGTKKSSKKIYTADPESKNLQVINAYLAQLQAYNDNLPLKIVDYVDGARKAIALGRVVDNKVLWGTDDPQTADYLENLFRKYINSTEWQAFESDIMSDLGLVAFENQETNEVDFISITGKTLRGDGSAPALIKNRKKLLGNVMRDDQSETLGFFNDVNNGDIELLKAFAFIQNNQATFKDKKIGSLFAVQLNSNQTVGSIATQTLSTVKKQWNGLISHGDDFELKGKYWEITEKDNYESLVSYVKEMFSDKNHKIKINKDKQSIVKDLNSLDKIVEKEKQIKILGDILAGLLNDIRTEKGLQKEASEKQELVFLVANAIAQLKGLDLSVETDAKNFGNIMGDNLMTSIPDRIRNSLVRHVVNAINTGLNDTKHKFNNDSKPLLDMHTNFYQGIKATDYQVKVTGNNYEYFENLVEKVNGKFTWRFKNPDTDSTLSPAESKYIKGYLSHINAIRRAKLVKTNGEGSDIITEFDLNPPREIPLMKATGYSALRNKGVKSYVKDYWESLANDTRVLESEDDYEEKIKFQTRMFNQFDTFDLSPDAREAYLEENEDSNLEIDLENVIYAYTMANAKQEVFDNVLITTNALKSIAMLSENFYFTNLDNVDAFIYNVVGSTAFGKKVLAGENKTLAKGAQALTGILSKATLGLSVPTIMNETFNNAFLSISKVFGASVGKKHFSKDSWMAAEALVWTDKLGKNQMNIGKMNFTRQLNAMYSIVESDLSQLQHANQSTSTSVGRNFNTNVAMKINQLPNFAHRMSFFVAQMIEDGVIKQSGGSFSKDSAMKLVDGVLTYNPKLDSRFALYLNHPNNSPVGRETEWKESRAHYNKIAELIAQEPNGIDETTGLISRPYENQTRDSLKSIADDVFGGYDPESKVMWTQTAFGQLFNQFKNWMWAKKHRIWSETDVNGRQGKFVYDKDLEEMIWKNDIMEGLGNSMWALFQEVKESRDLIGSWDKLPPERKERILWALSDLVLFALFSGLAAFLLGEFSAKEEPIANMMAKSMRNATSDLALWSAAKTVITPNNQIPILGTINKVVQGTIGMVTDDQRATQQMLNTLGLYRTIAPVAKTVFADEEK